MLKLMDGLHLARKYADDMHMMNEEGMLAQAIRLLNNLPHFDLDEIRRHYEGEDVPLPTARQVDEPIQSPMTSAPVPGAPLDHLYNPIRVTSHAPASEPDLPEPARRQRADQLAEGRAAEPAVDENGIVPEKTVDEEHPEEHEGFVFDDPRERVKDAHE